MASIIINDQVSEALKELQKRINNLEPVFRDIGQILRNSTEERFRKAEDPTGQPWATLQPWYQEMKKKHKGKILFLSGRLESSFSYSATNDSVTLGTNVRYAAIHQFGGVIRPKTAKGLAIGGFNSEGKAKGWAKKVTIPARPFLGISKKDNSDILQAITVHMASAWQ